MEEPPSIGLGLRLPEQSVVVLELPLKTLGTRPPPTRSGNPTPVPHPTVVLAQRLRGTALTWEQASSSFMI